MDKSFNLHGNIELAKLFEARAIEALRKAGYSETEQVVVGRGKKAVHIYEKDGKIISAELTRGDAGKDPVWTLSAEDNPDFDAVLADAAASLLSGISSTFKEVLKPDLMSEEYKAELERNLRKIVDSL